MEKRKNRLLLLGLILLSSVSTMFACTPKIYENLKLELSSYEMTVSLSDNAAENTFSIQANVTGRPKKYNGAVTFSISNPTNAIELVETSSVSDGKTAATFAAKNPGNAIVSVLTKEGNQRKRVNVTIIKPIENLEFLTTLLPISRNEMVNIASYINFTPSNTSQKGVTLQLGLPEGETAGLEELQKIQVTGTNVVVPTNAAISRFIVRAVSLTNEELTAAVEVVVVDTVSQNQISLWYDNNTPSIPTDDVELGKVGENFVLELARNTTDLNSKRIYFKFNNDDSLSTSYEVVGTIASENIVQLDRITTLSNTFDVKSVGEGNTVISFVVKHADYPNYSSLYKFISLKVTVVAYPKNILVTNGSTSTPVTVLNLYDNYSGNNRYGSPLKITITDNISEMFNQYATFSFSAQNVRLKIRDQYGVELRLGTKVLTGTTVYIGHNYTTTEVAPADLDLIITSSTYSQVTKIIRLNFIRGELVLGVDAENKTVKINKAQSGGVGLEFGYIEVPLTGPSETYDRTQLSVSIANTNLIKAVKSPSSIILAGLGGTGSTTATISAPNGSSVTITVVVFEALNVSTTTISVAGTSFGAVSEDATVANVRDTLGYVLNLRNGLPINIVFAINGNPTSTIPGDMNADTYARDLNGNVITTDVFVVKTIAYNQIATQNRVGQSLVTVTIRGYNELGNQDLKLTFKFVVSVEIPISTISTNKSEVTIYDFATLGINQKPTYGTYTITLNTTPYEASYTFSDITWSLVYQGTVYTVSPTFFGEGNQDVRYAFQLGNTSSNVTLETSRVNFKQAKVTVNLATAGADSEQFHIMAVVNQTYKNELGNFITARQETRVKFTAVKAVKVENIVFENVVNETVTFDSRDLNFVGGIFNVPVEQKTKTVQFTVLPSNTLTKELAVSYSSSSGITVTVNNATGTISIVANTPSSTNAPIPVIVYAVDSVIGVNQYTKYKIIQVEILDGSSETLAYKVSTAKDLQKMNQYLDAYYVLTNNIFIDQDASLSNWTPIGLKREGGVTLVNEFTGSLNGGYTVDGKTYYYSINGLRITNTSTEFPYNHIGLFGIIGEKGVVKNITFNNVFVEVIDNQFNTENMVFVGVIAGLNKGKVLNNTLNDGNAISPAFTNNIALVNNGATPLNGYVYGIKVNSTSTAERIIAVGGLVGVNQNQMTDNRIQSVLINFTDSSNSQVFAGGMVGMNDTKNAIITKQVENNYNSTSSVYDVVSAINIDNNLTVLNPNTSVGGLVGLNMGNVTNYVVSTIVVKAYDNVGGLIGQNAHNSDQSSLVNNNLVVPTIRGRNHVGGLVGRSQDIAYYLQPKAGKYNFFSSLNQNADVNFSAQITNNRVEFVDTNQQQSIYNTGIVGNNFVGGLVGTLKTYVGLNSGIHEFKHAVSYNSVFSYYQTRTTIANYYLANATTLSNNSYFGDMLLLNAHSVVEPFTTNENRNYAGGLFGQVTNGFLANNQFSASLQANGAIVGGVAGVVNGSQEGTGELFILNTSLQGTLVNRNLVPSGVTPITANFVGDATNLRPVQTSNLVSALNYENNATYANHVVTRSFSLLTQDQNVFVEHFAGLGAEKISTLQSFYVNAPLLFTIAWQNRTVSGTTVYHYATVELETTYDFIVNGGSTSVNYTIVSNSVSYNGTFDMAFTNLFHFTVSLSNFTNIIIDGVEESFANTNGYVVFTNNAYLSNIFLQNDPNGEGEWNKNISEFNKFKFGNQQFAIYRLTSDDNDNGINDADDLLVTNAISSLGNNYLQFGSLNETDRQNRINNLSAVIGANLNNLTSSYWYHHADLNGGIPVLLSSPRYLVTYTLNSQQVLSYATQIQLLSNWSPSDISVTHQPNYQTQFVTSSEPVSAVLFYNQIHSSYFLANGQINFGNNQNYSNELLNSLTSNVLSVLKAQNTYQLNNVFELKTVPSFIGSNAIGVVSSNPALLGVETQNGVTNLVVKGTGEVTLTISSNYNTSIKKQITVYLVNNILPFSQTQAGFQLNKIANGVTTKLKQVDAFSVVKSSEQAVKSVLLEASQNNLFPYFNNITGNVNFRMVNNISGGVRYFLTSEQSMLENEQNVTYHTLFSNKEISTTMTINNLNFTSVLQSNGKYVTYLDIPFGSNGVLSSVELIRNSFFSVPYVVTQNNEKVLLLNNEVLENNDGRVAKVGLNGNEMLNGYNYAHFFTVQTINGTWGIHSNVNSVSFDPMTSTNFALEVRTDNPSEVLYATYVDENNVSRNIRVDHENESYNGNTYAHGYRTFTIGKVTYNVTYSYLDGTKTYEVEAVVYDENKMTENYQTINAVFARDIQFFTLFDQTVVEYDETGKFIPTYLANSVEFSKTVSVTLNPQTYKNVEMSHYPNGELTVFTDTDGLVKSRTNLSEIAFNNIIPGYSGILKININPYYTNFDYLTLTTSGSNSNVVAFEQLLAEYGYVGGELLFNGNYRGIYPIAEQITNEIKLTKQSLVYAQGATQVKLFDGFFYVRTLINSFQEEGNTFTLTVKGFATRNGVVNQQVFTQELTLTVITPPGLNLNYLGDKTAAVAIGTSTEFTADLRGVSGRIVFSNSLLLNSLNQIVGTYGTNFSVAYVNDSTYRLTTSIGMNEGYFIRLIGTINKTINGKPYYYRDELLFKTTKFVINGVRVENVVNGAFVGVFNQTYELKVKLDVTYNQAVEGAAEAIEALENQWSTIVDANANQNFVWFYKDGSGNEVLIKHKGYNNSKTYILTTGTFSSGIVGFKLQNIVYNSPDILGARIKFVYTNNGVEIVKTTASNEQPNFVDYFVELSTSFTFGFYRVSSEDAPEPIRTASEFMAMQSGVDYILLSDITLENWTPMSTSIGSLDGNGYVITLKSFNLPAYNGTSTTLTSGNIGLFSQVNAITTLKNVTLEIAPSASVNITLESASANETSAVDFEVDAQSFSNINFGLIAGENYGIITNTNVVYDASELKLERDLMVALHNSDNPDFAAYWNNGVFNYDNFLRDNVTKYFPRKVITESNKANLWDETNGVVFFHKLGESLNTRRDLSVVRVKTTVTTTAQTHYMGGMVGVNYGTITNSSVENVTLNGVGYVAGFVANNNGKIASSYFKGANIINRTTLATNSGTAGFVAYNSGTVQYSYAIGREGDGNSFVYAQANGNVSLKSKDVSANYNVSDNVTRFVTKSNYADKTGLTPDAKSKFAGYYYNTFRNTTYDYTYMYGAQRAMNSAIIASSDVGGFVFNNSGTISNSYANIMVNSSTATAGFVFRNTNNGKIRDVYSLSSVQNNSRSHSPFTGKDSADVYNNAGTIEYASYLKASGTLTNLNNMTDKITYADAFIDENEPATFINSGEVMDYNSYQGFAFNPDYSVNKNLDRSVWFIGNGNELANNGLTNFKRTVYLQNRPELVSANLQTLSVRVLVSGSGSQENVYSYLSSVIGKNISNPILVRTAEEFNKYVTQMTSTATVDGEQQVEQYNYIRLVKDITFNIFDIKAQTYNIHYYGDLDGNGMTINQLRLVSDSSFENEDISQVSKLGLFGSVGSKFENDMLISRGVVRNLNIGVSEVRGTNATYVGVLAGIIENASIYNISISGSEIIQGKHIVGGLAGYIAGDSEIVNISVSGIGAKASYYKQVNPFGTNNYSVLHENMGKVELFHMNYAGDNAVLTNPTNISYVGGIAGILSVKELEDEENLDSTLRSARARRLTVEGSVYLVGEVVGGVFGGVDESSTANDVNFLVSGTPRLIASRIAGGLVGELRGMLDRATLRHTDLVQNNIDNAIKNSAATVLNNKFVNSTQNYNNLFSGNPQYLGGLIGFNNDGKLSNSYNKLNVLNLNALYAGGITGLNVGGEYHNVYTTASVNAFKVVGGFIALQVQQTYLTQEKTLVSGMPTSELMFIHYANSGLTSASRTTILNGAVALNIWRQSDLNVVAHADTYIGANQIVIGGMVGKLLLSEKRNDGSGALKYFLSDAFTNDGSLSVSTRKFNDVNYFNQVYLNNYFGTNGMAGGEGSANFSKLMQEIGMVNTESILSTNSSIVMRQNGEPDLRASAGVVSYTGTSGSYVVGDDVVVTYHFSRMQNLASARTVKEFLQRMYVQSEGSNMGDGTTVATSDVLPKTYYSWPTNYWKGIGVTHNDGAYEVIDPSFVFPHVVPVADLTTVYVYTAEDLALMGTYRKANFILMNDIDLSVLPQWTAHGTSLRPFMGSISSYGTSTFTISNLRVNSDSNPYIGLVGYAKDATFSNFKLTVLSLNVQNVSSNNQVYIGSLFGYGEEVFVNNVAISSATASNFVMSAYSVVGMGGIAGASINSQYNNVSVKDANLTVVSPQMLSEKDGIYVGGAFGLFTNEVLKLNQQQTALFHNLTLNDVQISAFQGTILPSGFTAQEIGVGGAFGKIIGGTNAGLVNVTNSTVINGGVSVRVRFNNGAQSSTLNTVAVSGFVAINNAAFYDSQTNNNKVNNNSVSLTTDYYNKATYVSGVFAKFSGFRAEDFTANTVELWNVNGLEFNNNTVAYAQQYRNGTLDNASNIYLGGVFAWLGSGNIANISANTTQIRLNNNISESVTNANALYVGGVAGEVVNTNRVTQVISNATIDRTNNYVINAYNAYYGGLFGSFLGINNGEGISQVAASGSIRAFANINGGVVAMGGLIGSLNNAKLDQAISNTTLYANRTTSVSQVVYAGGLVGQVTTESTLPGVLGKVAITNSYSAGEIAYHGNFTEQVVGQPYHSYLGGFIGYVYVESGAVNQGFALENSYTISRFVFAENYYSVTNSTNFINKTNKGGLVGTIVQNDGDTSSTTQNVSVWNAYYNAELTPYSNSIGTALKVNEMLFQNTNTYGLNATELGAWKVENNKYPLLKWADPTNITLSVFARSFQALGQEQNPMLYAGTLAENTAYIVEDYFNAYDGVETINNTIYFKSSAEPLTDGVGSVDWYSVLYGAKTEASIELVYYRNNGFINNVKGDYSLLENYGIVFYSELNTISYNFGVIDKVKAFAGNNAYVWVDSNELTGYITESIVVVEPGANNGKIRNSYFYTEASSAYYYFNGSNGESISYSINSNVNPMLFENWSTATHYDFVNVWAMFTTNGLDGGVTANLNHGKPMLRWTLKTHWLNQNIVSNYEWAQSSGAVFGTYYDDHGTMVYTDMLLTLSQNNVSISSAEQLAQIAYMTSVGKVISTTVSKEFGLNSVSIATNYLGSMVTQITTTTYNYGVKTVVVKEVVDLNGVTLNLNNNISLSGKLWTPIGYGLTNGETTIASVTNQDFNTIKGKLNGNGYVISNIASIQNGNNAGLFGTVEVNTLGAQVTNGASFANNIILSGGFVVNINTNSGNYDYAAGSLAGKIYYSNLEANTIINGFGNQLVAVGSYNFAGGIFGQVVKNSVSTNANLYPIIYRAYNTGAVYSSNYAAGFGASVSQNNSSKVHLQEVYFAGSLTGQTNIAFVYNKHNGVIITSNAYNVFASAGVLATTSNTSAYSTWNDYYGGYSIITETTLRSFNLNNFNWNTTGGWFRVHNLNQAYPLFNTTVSYWYNNTTSVTPSGNTYTITTSSQLAWVARQVANGNTFLGKTIFIQNNLNMANALWTPIGTDDSHAFMGTLEGNNKTISNLISYGVYLPNPVSGNMEVTYNNVGLFGYTTGATISNLTIDNDNIASNLSVLSGYSSVGGFVGYSNDTTFTNLTNKANVFGYSGVGGIVGRTEDGSNYYIQNNNNSGTISGVSNVGGIAGESTTNIVNSTNSGSIIGTTYVGGIVGTGYNLTNNTNSGSVVGDAYVGGIAGRTSASILGQGNANADKYDNTGSVTGRNFVGGIVGRTTGSVEAVTNIGAITIANPANTTYTANVGGVIGFATNNVFEVINRGSITLQNSYSGVTYIGGVIGAYGNTGRMTNLFNATSSLSYNNVANNGSLVGFMSGTIGVNSVSMAATYPSSITRKIGNTTGAIFSVVEVSAARTSATYTNALTGESNTEKQVFTDTSVWNGDTVMNYKQSIPSYTGTGTSGNPYIIDSEDDIRYATYVNSRRYITTRTYDYYSLSANVTTSYSFGNETYPFVGYFNGQGRTITLQSAVFKNNTNGVGLFNYVASVAGYTSQIYNLIATINNIATISLNGSNFVGPLVGKGFDVTLQTITVSSGATQNSTISAGNSLGGVAGYLKNAKLIGVNTATTTRQITLNGTSNVGGIVGTAVGLLEINKDSALITINSNQVGTESNAASYSGGIVGRFVSAVNNNVINNVRNNKKVYGAQYTGGIIGLVESTYYTTTAIQITNVSNRAEIRSTSGNTGGIAGSVQNTTISNSNITSSTAIYGGGQNTGGIVGSATGSVISNNTAIEIEVLTGLNRTGGIAGNISNTNVTGNTYQFAAVEYESSGYFTPGNIVGNQYVGGIVGYADGSSVYNINNNTIKKSDTITEGHVATVRGSNYVSGIVGRVNGMKVENNILNGFEVRANSYAGALAGDGGSNTSFISNSATDIKLVPTVNLIDVWVHQNFQAWGKNDTVWVELVTLYQYGLKLGSKTTSLSNNFGLIAGAATAYTNNDNIFPNSYIDFTYYYYNMDLEKAGELGTWTLYYDLTQYKDDKFKHEFGNETIASSSFTTTTVKSSLRINHSSYGSPFEWKSGTQARDHFRSLYPSKQSGMYGA